MIDFARSVLPLLARRQLLLLGTLGLFPRGAWAHNFETGQGAYQDFLSGNQAVLADLPIVLGLIATGILVGIWKTDRLPRVWLFYNIGALLGVFMGFSGVVPPVLPAYIAVCLIGLLAAASPAISVFMMRLIVGVMGAIFANAVLSGHTIDEIQTFAYLGIFFALNLGLAAPAAVVTISREKLEYGWVYITWRALSSWLVAISIMAMVLMLRTGG